MESTLKKIFSGNIDNEIHNEFIKFSKGKFDNRYLIEAKKQKGKWKIKSSNEFANFFVRKCLEKVQGEVNVKGVIVCTFDLRKEASFEISSIKQFMGVKQYVIDCTTEAKNIIDLMDKQPRAFYALSFSTNGNELKIKAKAPKSAKPSAKGGGVSKANFCSLKTNDKEIINDFFFDFLDFKEIYIKHTIQIDEIILPNGVDDPVKIRELSRRKGRIIRDVKIDGRVEAKEKEFEA